MLELVIGVVVVLVDQLSKVLCTEWLTSLPGSTYPLIEGVFHLSYVENRGAAFGMLQNARWFFIAITVAVLAGIIYCIIKYRKQMHVLLRVCLALVAAGALGNLIDRIALGYVRDMFYFALIDFAVFNVADAALSVSAVILVFDLLFGKSKKLFADKGPAKAELAEPSPAVQQGEEAKASEETTGEERQKGQEEQN